MFKIWYNLLFLLFIILLINVKSGLSHPRISKIFDFNEKHHLYLSLLENLSSLSFLAMF